MTSPLNPNPNIQIQQRDLDIRIDNVHGENVDRNSELGHVKGPSKLALFGRILLGICTLGISEGIRAIVRSIQARNPAQPRFDENVNRVGNHHDEEDPGTVIRNLISGEDEVPPGNFTRKEIEKELTDNLPKDQDVNGTVKNVKDYAAALRLTMMVAVDNSTNAFPNKTYRSLLVNHLRDLPDRTIKNIVLERSPSREMLNLLLEEYDNLRSKAIVEKVKTHLDDDRTLRALLQSKGVPNDRQGDYIALIRKEFDNEGRFMLLITMNQNNRRRESGDPDPLLKLVSKSELDNPNMPGKLTEKIFNRLFDRAQAVMDEMPKVKGAADSMAKKVEKLTTTDTLFDAKNTIQVPKAGTKVLMQSKKSNTGFIMSVLNALLWNKDGPKYLKVWFQNHIPTQNKKFERLNAFESYMTALLQDPKIGRSKHRDGDIGNAAEVLVMLNLEQPLEAPLPQMIQSQATSVEAHGFWAQTTQNLKNGQMAVILDGATHHYRTIVATTKRNGVEAFTVLDSLTGTAQNFTYEELVSSEDGKKNAAFVSFFSLPPPEKWAPEE